jgi:hypothetical protein
MRRSLARTAAFILLLVSSAFAAAPTRTAFAVPRHGNLTLELPAGWSGSVRDSDTGLPPTIRLVNGGGTEILLTPFWSLRKQPGFNAPERIHTLVEKMAASAAPTSVEGELPLHDIVTASGTGYYIQATDRAPKEGEYPYMAQGSVPAGELLVGFTVLTHTKPPRGLQVALAIVRSVQQQP